MTIQHYNYCRECETEWHRKHGDRCPDCGRDC
jgi:hypothetical protein